MQGVGFLPVGPFSVVGEYDRCSVKLRQRGKRIERYAQPSHESAALCCVHYAETIVTHRTALHQYHLLARSEVGTGAVRYSSPARSARESAN